MTREEAIKLIPHVVYAYNTKDFTRGSFTATEWFKTVRKALEQESVIEDIKAEIEIEIQDCQIPQGHDAWWNGRKCGLEDALEIIDKHISGGEE